MTATLTGALVCDGGPTPQVLMLSTNLGKVRFCDVPSPQRDVPPEENTLIPPKRDSFPRKQSRPQRNGVSHLS